MQAPVFSRALEVSCRAHRTYVLATNQNIKINRSDRVFCGGCTPYFLPTFIIPQASVAVFVF